MPTETLDDLTSLGLTALEAEIYLHLLGANSLSGYAIAKAIGKPTANTYKALGSLHEKGGVILEEGERREFTAVPPAEFLGGLGRGIAERVQRTTRRLLTRSAAPRDDRVYVLRAPEQVIGRFKEMIGSSRAVAIVDAFPWALAALAPELEAAAARGVRVAAKAYEPFEIPGVRIVIDPQAQLTRARWSGEWANGAVDGEQHLLAWLAPRGARVRQAIWSGSAFLTWTYHGGLVHEIVDAFIEHELARGADAATTLTEARALARSLLDDVPGAEALRRAAATDADDVPNAAPHS